MRIIFDEINEYDKKQILELIELKYKLKRQKEIKEKQNRLKNDDYYE